MKKKLTICALLIALCSLTSCSTWSWSPAEGLKFKGKYTGTDYQLKARPDEGIKFKADKSF